MNVNAGISAAILVIEPRPCDFASLEVRRVLPSGRRRTVGPLVLIDPMRALVFPAGQGIDVRPRPHIGLATATRLFEGQIIHRDSPGYVQAHPAR